MNIRHLIIYTSFFIQRYTKQSLEDRKGRPIKLCLRFRAIRSRQDTGSCINSSYIQTYSDIKMYLYAVFKTLFFLKCEHFPSPVTNGSYCL